MGRNYPQNADNINLGGNCSVYYMLHAALKEVLMSAKKRFVKVKSVAQKSSYIDREGNISLSDLLDGQPPGESDGYLISIVEMTQEEFNALPEFAGF